MRLIINAFLINLLVSFVSHAEMLISPLRLMLDENNKSATLTIRNTGDGTRSYRLGWLEQQMNEAGTYEAIPSDQLADFPIASKHLRFSPRQISVGPGENQTVRVSYRPPANIEVGEYRSHLLLKILPDSAPSGSFEVGGGEEGISMQLNMLMSFAVPVVVRHQADMPEVAITKVDVLPADANNNLRLALTLSRSGNSSSYGTLRVEMQANANSPVELIGLQDDLSIFTEVTQRRVVVPLRDQAIPSGAWIRISYQGKGEYSGHTFAEQVFRNE